MDNLKIIGQIVRNAPDLCYNDLVVSNENYAKLLADTIKAMQDRLAELRKKRGELVTELEQLDATISLAIEDIETASTIWGRSPFGTQAIGQTKPLVGKGFTESIEYVLRTLGTRLSPTDVRDKMQEWGYDFS